jgi:hypothetical protein
MASIKYLHFYSIIAIILHLLYFLNIIGNTYPIALFVLVISQILLLFCPGYIYMYGCKYILVDIILHWMPYIVIKEDYTNTNYLLYSLILYLIIFGNKVIRIYKNPLTYIQ